MKKDELRKIILDVLKYQDGDYYIGSLMTARVHDIFSVEWGIDSIADAVNKASIKTLREAYEYLKDYINHMLEHPVDKCPLCRSSTRRENFRTNTLVVEFVANYIPTLIKTVSKEKAIDRIVEEASVTIRLEAEKLIDRLTNPGEV